MDVADNVEATARGQECMWVAGHCRCLRGTRRWRISRAAGMPRSSMMILEAERKEISAKSPAALAGCERWYVAYTKPHCETRAQVQIENQGFHTFLPRREQTIR